MTATLVLGLALGVGAPALKEKEKPPSLVGEWVIEQCTVGGKAPQAAPPGRDSTRWVFRADGSRAILGPDGKEIVGGSYTSDVKAGTLDLDSTGGPAGGQYLCLYKLEGDTLTLNVGWQKAPRPTAFESPPDSQCTLYVMKRVKPKD
jgi:uncharacterized protein (TIGR03067 family)